MWLHTHLTLAVPFLFLENFSQTFVKTTFLFQHWIHKPTFSSLVKIFILLSMIQFLSDGNIIFLSTSVSRVVRHTLQLPDEFRIFLWKYHDMNLLTCCPLLLFPKLSNNDQNVWFHKFVQHERYQMLKLVMNRVSICWLNQITHCITCMITITCFITSWVSRNVFPNF